MLNSNHLSRFTSNFQIITFLRKIISIYANTSKDQRMTKEHQVTQPTSPLQRLSLRIQGVVMSLKGLISFKCNDSLRSGKKSVEIRNVVGSFGVETSAASPGVTRQMKKSMKSSNAYFKTNLIKILWFNHTCLKQSHYIVQRALLTYI